MSQSGISSEKYVFVITLTSIAIVYEENSNHSKLKTPEEVLEKKKDIIKFNYIDK